MISSDISPGSYSRILFVDFSSAFNTIQPHLMMEKLVAMHVNPCLIRWIHSFLTSRPQAVRIGDKLSKELVTNTGAPQGGVLSPVLFTLYTADCRVKEEGNLLIKFADDTSLSGFIQKDDTHYLEAVSNLVAWCDSNFLELNVVKTKEMVVDFRKTNEPIKPLVIKGQAVDIVDSYKYLGTTIDDKLKWTPNISECCKKGRKRMFFLRKMRQFKMHGDVMALFYQTVVQSAVFFNLVCYYGNAQKADRERLERMVSDAASITGRGLDHPSTMYEAAILAKAKKIQADISYPLHVDL